MAGAGRAEVERFLLHCLSPSLLVGFILSDSSLLQKFFARFSLIPTRILAALGAGCCSQEPPGVSGDICTHVPPPATPAQLPLHPGNPQGKDLSLWHPGTPPPPYPENSMRSSGQTTRPHLQKPPLHSLGFSCLHSSWDMGIHMEYNIFSFLSCPFPCWICPPHPIGRSEGALQVSNLMGWWQIRVCLSYPWESPNQ